MSIPSFGDFVADKWQCDINSQAEERATAIELAESIIFDGKPDEHQMEEATSVTGGCIPELSASKSEKDDDNTKPPYVLDVLDKLAAEYFGHNWDRVDEMIQVNASRLEAWKAARSCKQENPVSPQAPKRTHSAMSISSDADGSQPLVDDAPPPTPPPYKRRGAAVDLGEDAIDLILEGVPGAAVEDGRSASIPGLDLARLILLEVYLDHCPQCDLLAPKLKQAAEHFRHEPRIMICKVNGPANPAFLERLDVQFYPTLKIIDRDIRTVFDWPMCSPIQSSKDIIEVLNTYLERQKTVALPKTLLATPAAPVIVDTVMKELSSDHPPSFQEISTLKDELVCHRDLSSRRRWVSAMEIFRQLGCSDEESCRALTRSHTQPEDDPPHLVMMGGGMGSGKSSLKRLVTQTEFWRRYGREVVQVEADHFKAIDPVYQLLKNANETKASEHVHKYSTQAAEELFLSAIRFRRDIIFDSTLAWAPFLEQTLQMVRDTKHSYRRGPGYIEPEDGDEPVTEPVTEQYWEMIDEPEGEKGGGSNNDDKTSSQEAATTVPYRVELIGVYVRPEVAVRRALVRQILTGRGVPVREQLRSHALFAKNFEAFASRFDTVILYDNNHTHERGECIMPREIARKDCTDKDLRILDESAFRSFQAVAQLNIDATCVEELYISK